MLLLKYNSRLIHKCVISKRKGSDKYPKYLLSVERVIFMTQSYCFGVTVSSKTFVTKWKYFPTISKNMLIINCLCKQYGSRSGPTKCGAWSSIHVVWYLASNLAKNWLFCMEWLEFSGYRNFVNFTKCSRNFGGHCIFLLFYHHQNNHISWHLPQVDCWVQVWPHRLWPQTGTGCLPPAALAGTRSGSTGRRQS